MATGYYTRVANTEVSGSSLQSGLHDVDIRALEFDASLKSVPPIVMSDGDVPISTVGPLSEVEYFMQAAIRSLPIDMSALAAGNILGSNLDLGPDVASQASAYTVLFDLKTTSDVRILRMFMSAAPPTNDSNNTVYLVNSTGATAGPYTTNHVHVQLNGGANASYALLFDPTVDVGNNSWGGQSKRAVLPGTERIILVSSPNLASGNEEVTFNVLGKSL